VERERNPVFVTVRRKAWFAMDDNMVNKLIRYKIWAKVQSGKKFLVFLDLIAFS